MALQGLDARQVQQAVKSLLKYIGNHKAASNALLEDDEFIHLIVALKKTPSNPRKDKPVRIEIPHSLQSHEGAEICLIVKDHKGEGHKAAKAKLQGLEKKSAVTKVLGLSKLKTKYESFEAKRQLCGLYDLFLADQRVLPSLPKLLGKSFFKKKKQPIPVDLSKKDWTASIKRACDSTYLFWTGSSCLNIKVARSSFTEEQVTENINAVLQAAAEHIPKKWKNVQAVYIKTAESVSLPLYQVLPDQPLKIAA